MLNPVSIGISMFITGMATIGMMWEVSMISEIAAEQAKLTPTEREKRTQEAIDEYNEHNVR